MYFCEDDRERFLEICRIENEREKEFFGIGTYKEQIIHQVMKEYFCPNKDNQEVKFGKYIADAFDGENIYEVQTSAFYLMKGKLKYYLENTNFDVYLIHPLAVKKYVAKIDKETKELVGNIRKSPKSKKITDILPELSSLVQYFGKKRLHFIFPLIEIADFRVFNPSKSYKNREELYKRVPSDIFDIIEISNKAQLKKALNGTFKKKEYSISEFKKELSLKKLKYWSAEKFLAEVGIIEKTPDDTPSRNRVLIKVKL